MADKPSTLIVIQFRSPDGHSGEYRFFPVRRLISRSRRDYEELPSETPPRMKELLRQLKRDKCHIIRIEQKANKEKRSNGT